MRQLKVEGVRPSELDSPKLVALKRMQTGIFAAVSASIREKGDASVWSVGRVLKAMTKTSKEEFVQKGNKAIGERRAGQSTAESGEAYRFGQMQREGMQLVWWYSKNPLRTDWSEFQGAVETRARGVAHTFFAGWLR